MRVEGGRCGMEREAGSRDQFPIGMRVLAVDDDPTCLKVLEALLLRCQYHVTTTNQAITALKLLRENKDKFDLVISDVHMPDMDGFKLLELVGLEMDLPVIMLSVNGETKTVMKGITHGACDYLLKPVRIEELRNIWQHVVRRKFNHREKNNSFDFDHDEFDKPPILIPEHGPCQIITLSADHGSKVGKKRKDQDSEEEDDIEENVQENGEHSAQKKPRVVWSVDLHRKFVAAVNQLGIDKAVPKRILELMDVDKLTRENVASHLQKYRLYLKRLSIVASHQASIVAAFGGRDPSYLHTLDRFQSYNALAASSHLPALASFQSSGFHGLSHSGSVQFGHTHNTVSNPINNPSKFQVTGLPGNQHGSLLPGMGRSLEPEHMKQQNWMHGFPGSIIDGADFTSTPLLQQTSLECTQSKAIVQSSIEMPSVSVPISSPQTGFPANSSPIGTAFDNKSLTRIGADFSAASKIKSIPANISSCNLLAGPAHSPATGRDSKYEVGMFGDVDEVSKLLSFTDAGNYNQTMAGWKQDKAHDSKLLSSSFLNSQLPIDIVADYTAPIQTHADCVLDPTAVSHCQNDMLNSDGQLKLKDEHVSGVPKMQGGFGSNACSYDGLLNSIIKLERDDSIAFTDGGIGCDLYPLGACM